MKSRAERLRVLIQDDGGDGSDYVVNQIIAICKECVPEERNGKHNGHSEDDGYCYTCRETSEEEDLPSFGDWAFNACRTETLKNIEEMGK